MQSGVSRSLSNMARRRYSLTPTGVRNAINDGRRAGQVARDIFNTVSRSISRGRSETPRGRPPTRGRPTPRTPRSAGVRKRTYRYGTSNARFVGRFNRPRKLRRKLDPMTKAKAYGSHRTQEYYGTITDPHCAFVIHNTHNIKEIAKAITFAIFRKLFAKAGMDITSRNNVLELVSENTNGTGMWAIIWSRESETTADTAGQIYEITANDSFQSMVDSSQFFFSIEQYLNSNSVLLPHNVSLVLRPTPNAPDVDTRRIIAKLDLYNEHISIGCESGLKIQNRTKGDSVTPDADADRVDNGPVYGYIYEMKGGHPKLRTREQNFDQRNFFNAINWEGLKLGRAAQVPEMAEPPAPRYFMNCIKSSKIKLDPGQIKTTMLKHQYSGKYRNVMQRIRAKTYDNAQPTTFPDLVTGIPGKCQIVMLEEMIRSITSNDIILVYERQYRVGCHLKTKKPLNPISTILNFQSINNIAP